MSLEVEKRTNLNQEILMKQRVDPSEKDKLVEATRKLFLEMKGLADERI